MKERTKQKIVILAACVIFANEQKAAEEQVTIPKTRMEELERKEKELETLTGELNKKKKEAVGIQERKGKEEAEQLEQDKKENKTKAEKGKGADETGEIALAQETLPMASLPPLKQGDVVNAMDLMNHYRADPKQAAKRYEAQRIRVEGEIIGFEKSAFVRRYAIFLKTSERRWKVTCKVEPPESISAVFTGKEGEQMIGSTSDGNRSTLARVGQKAIIEGYCKGLKEQNVTVAVGRLVSVE